MPKFFRRHRIRFSQRRDAVICRRVIALTLILSLAVWFTVTLYHKAAPIAVENAPAITQAKWEDIAHTAVESVLSENAYTYDSFATATTDSAGKIIAISVNSTAIATLRSALVRELNRAFSENNRIKIPVPIGTLLAPVFLGGKGFSVRVSALAYTSLSVTVISEVSAVGINQTLHRISVRITTDTTLYCINEKSTFTHTLTAPLAESLTFAGIPESYFEYAG